MLLGGRQGGDVAVPEHLGSTGPSAYGVLVVLGLPLGRALVVGQTRRARHLGPRRPRPRQPVATLEVGPEHLVEPLEIVGPTAEGGPTGEVRRPLVVEPQRGRRRQEALRPVLRHGYAGSAQRPREPEQDLVAAALHHARNIWSSACRTRSASSRYFTSAPKVADADARSISAVPR